MFCFRVIDVGSEWRTFSNDKDTKDASRVGASEVSHHSCKITLFGHNNCYKGELMSYIFLW